MPGLHASRIDFWKTSYKEEKRSLLNQYHAEMQRYRDRKFKSFRELECVYYGLESKVDRERNEAVEHHLRKCDNVKSGVSIKSQNIKLYLNSSIATKYI